MNPIRGPVKGRRPLLCSLALLARRLTGLLVFAASANADPLPPPNLTAVPPFIGAQSETWEEFPVEKFGDAGVPILGGTATVTGTFLETAVYPMFRLCTFFAVPTDGMTFMGANVMNSSMTISFSQPVSAFGAYWGGFPASCSADDTYFSFFDADGNTVGIVGVAPGSGGMTWHGYAFVVPVKTVMVRGTFVVTDGMQATQTLAPSLANISTRSLVQTGDGVLIGGFIVTGNQPKKVLLRGLGPSLGSAGLTGVLANPSLELHSGSAVIASNNNWQDTQKTAIAATGLQPANPIESAIIATLAPGSYTAILAGQSGGTGIGLVEIYDLDQAGESRLANISTRGFVGTGNEVMIGGLILSDTTRVLVRALGPSLTEAGVSDALLDPVFELHGADGTLIASDDDWHDVQPTEIEATGIPPTDPRESAILRVLTAGNYTAIVRGADGTTGNALVEAYAQ